MGRLMSRAIWVQSNRLPSSALSVSDQKQFRIGVDLAEWTAALGLPSFQAGLYFLRGKIWLIICGHVRFLLNQVSEGRL